MKLCAHFTFLLAVFIAQQASAIGPGMSRGKQALIKVLAGTPAGTALIDGPRLKSRFADTWTLSFNASGDLIVLDRASSVLRKISAAGIVTILAGNGSNGFAEGAGTAAKFNYPSGFTVAPSGDIYVADTNNFRIRKVTAAGVVSTIAGGSYGTNDGTGGSAQFEYVTSISADPTTGVLYVSDQHRIRKVTAAGVVTTIAGTTAGAGGYADGTGTGALFKNPQDIAVDSSGNLFVADLSNKRIRKVTTAGVVTTFAGSGTTGTLDATGTSAQFDSPAYMKFDAGGNLFVVDLFNSRIRKITSAAVVTTYIGSSSGSSDSPPLFGSMRGLAIKPNGDMIVSDQQMMLRYITALGVVSTYAGGAAASYTLVDGTGPAATVGAASAVAFDSAGNAYVAQEYAGIIRKITPAGVVSTFAGSGAGSVTDGTGTAASFSGPVALAMMSTGTLYVLDNGFMGNSYIRTISPAGVVTTVAGGSSGGYVNGSGTAARFNGAVGMAIDSSNNLYITDQYNARIRKMNPSYVVSTFSGAGTSGSADGASGVATFYYPRQIVADASNLYVYDYGSMKVRSVSLATGAVTTLSGNGVNAPVDGSGSTVSFSQNVTAFAIDPKNRIFITEGNRVRMLTTAGVATSVLGDPLYFGAAEGPLPGTVSTAGAIGFYRGLLHVFCDNAVVTVPIP